MVSTVFVRRVSVITAIASLSVPTPLLAQDSGPPDGGPGQEPPASSPPGAAAPEMDTGSIEPEARPPASAPPAASPPCEQAPSPKPRNDQSMGFISKFLDEYTTEYAYVPTTPPPPGRGLSAALDAPPFPAAHWSLNGTPDIGVPDSSIYPLMGALYASGAKALEDSRIKLYGWVDSTLNVGTSTAYRGNYPIGYQLNPNTFSLQQAFARLERLPDTTQASHVDWGFRVDALYGIDYRFTTMNGIFSNQLRNNDLYGYDLNEFYVDLYIPGVGDGLDIRVGRFISIPDIEANLT
ncbi:MAG: outer membrane beta-barrel protein, partial [Polyangiaceae bacterium]|nr:outer membrane beta-barrel protein [Polyangiaceae bacterium]